jgi:hypothetical protein
MKLLFHIYVKYMRKHTSSLLWQMYKTIQPVNSTLWKTYRTLSMEEFSRKINEYEYLPEIGGGVLDYSFHYGSPNYFFSALKVGRDCGAWARIWLLWGEYNGYTAQEVVVTTKRHIMKDSHIITILEKNNKYYCMNYTPHGPYKTFTEAVESVTTGNTYTKDNLLWLKYNGIR